MDQSAHGTSQHCIPRADACGRRKSRPLLSQFVICALVLLQVAFLSALAIADQLTLKDGRKLQGRLISKSSSQVVFEIQRGTATITQNFSTAEVANIAVGQPSTPTTSPSQSTIITPAASPPVGGGDIFDRVSAQSASRSPADSAPDSIPKAPVFNPNAATTPDEDYKNGMAAAKANDYVAATAFFRRAAEKGNADAQCYMGINYVMGRGVPANDVEAITWFQKSALQGNADAQCYMGINYVMGRGVPANDMEAITWFQKSALQGNGAAEYGLGWMCEHGRGVNEDDAVAVEWYRKAADQEFSRAQSELASMYARGRGVPQDYRLAVDWFRKAADHGNAVAQGSLGAMYERGQGVPKDYRLALEWYRKAADQGEPVAEWDLGNFYASGRGVPQDYQLAVEWYRKAADQGDAEAQCDLGWQYYLGRGVPRDYKQAMEWFRRGSAQGSASADYYIGWMYARGVGVPQDNEQAIEWYKKAADQGYPDAQTALAYCYKAGIGVTQSDSAAIDYFYKGATGILKGDIQEPDRGSALVIYDEMRSIDPLNQLTQQLKEQLYPSKAAAGGADSKPDEATVSLGTGWPVAEGYVITNHHVVAGASKFTVIRADGVKMSASVAAKDVTNDLALLKVDDPTKLPAGLPLASKLAAIGEHVFTIGFPVPDVMGTNAKLTDGTVSAVTGIDDDPRILQIGVALQPGNSGGPLLNSRGEVVGVVKSKLNAIEMFKRTGQLSEGVSYAMKVSYLRALLDTAPQKPTSKVLGAQEAPLPDLAKRVEGSILRVICE